MGCFRRDPRLSWPLISFGPRNGQEWLLHYRCGDKAGETHALPPVTAMGREAGVGPEGHRQMDTAQLCPSHHTSCQGGALTLWAQGWGVPASPTPLICPWAPGGPCRAPGRMGREGGAGTWPLAHLGTQPLAHLGTGLLWPSYPAEGPGGLTGHKVTVLLLLRELWAGLGRGTAALGDLAVARGLVAGLAEPQVWARSLESDGATGAGKPPTPTTPCAGLMLQLQPWGPAGGAAGLGDISPFVTGQL